MNGGAHSYELRKSQAYLVQLSMSELIITFSFLFFSSFIKSKHIDNQDIFT